MDVIDLKLIQQEWKEVFRDRILIASVIVMLFIPVIYSALILDSFWNPYEKTGDLAVAVVNHDKPADYSGGTLDIGAELVDRLKDNRDADWHFVSEETAESGFQGGDYYMVITIPENFSAHAATAFEENPQPMNLQYEVDPGRNYFNETLGRTTIDRLNERISAQVTEEYVKTIFSQFEAAGSKLADAADGASEVHSAAGRLLEGNGQITKNLTELSEGTAAIQERTVQIQSGMAEVTAGAEELDAGASRLNGALGTLAAGSGELERGLEQMSAQLPSQSEIGRLTSGLADVQSTINQLQTLAAESDLPPQLQKQLTELTASVNSVQQGAIEALGGYSVIRTALEGPQGLIQGATQLRVGLYEAADGSAELAEGTSRLTAELPYLSDGVDGLHKGAGQLREGATQLTEASGRLSDGLSSLQEGSGALAARLSEGTGAIDRADMLEGNYEMIAKPLTVTEQQVSEVPNYGHALAPNFLSLGLYIGAMAFTLIFPFSYLSRRSSSGSARWLSKFTIGFAFSVTGALILDAVMIFGMGLEVENVGQFILISILASLAYLFLVMLFNAALGNLGRLLSMLFLVLQVIASGGTLPVELQSSFYQTVNPYLPMTYVIYGFREAMTSAVGSDLFLTSTAILVACIVLFNLLLFFALRRQPMGRVWRGLQNPDPVNTELIHQADRSLHR